MSGVFPRRGRCQGTIHDTFPVLVIHTIITRQIRLLQVDASTFTSNSAVLSLLKPVKFWFPQTLSVDHGIES